MPKRKRRYNRKTDSVDAYVAWRIRKQRILVGMSLEELAQCVGVSYQQIQNYEGGADRITAGKFYAISLALEVPIEWFYEGYDKKGNRKEDFKDTRETLQLVRHFLNCTPAIQKILLALFNEVGVLSGRDRL